MISAATGTVAEVRTGAVRALAGHGDVEEVDRSHGGTDAEAEDAFVARPFVVAAVDFADAVLLEDAGVCNGRGAAARFFGGLEDADHLAGEVAAAGENVEGAERPGRVAVVAAGVAAARLAALPGIVGVVRHRQRVDVPAKGHGLTRAVPLDDGDHGARNGRGVDFVDAPGAKLLNDLSAGARRFEGEFGVLVQVVTEFDEFVEDFKGFREADFRTEGADHRFLLMKLARGAQTEFF